jgi:RNA 2',3'-cyclic 3'-phosphodiesterase
MEAIRTFIAIELPDSIRQQLNQIELQIQAKAGEAGRRGVRWVPTGNMHLTLKFLGEVSTANIQALAGMLQTEAGRYAPFDFTIGELGAFPNARRPRVIWVGADAPAALMGLQKAIEAETRLLGYPAEERPFSPHLTLGRIAQNAHSEEVAQVARALGEMKVGRLGVVRVEKVHLFKSDLRPSGAVYTSLHSFQLSA